MCSPRILSIVALCGLMFTSLSLADDLKVGQVILPRQPGEPVTMLQRDTGAVLGTTSLKNWIFRVEIVKNGRLGILNQGHPIWVNPEQFIRADRAEAFFREGIANDYNNATNFCGLGIVQLQQEDWSGARASFQKAIDRRKDYFEAKFGLANAYLYMNKLDEAIDLLTQLTVDRKDHALTENALAIALANKGKHDEARLHFRIAADLEPGNLSYSVNLARSYEAQNRPEQAIKVFQRLTEENKNNPIVYLLLGTAHFRMEQFDEAIASLNQAIALKEPTGDAYHFLGRALVSTGETDKAITALSKVPPYPLADSYLKLRYNRRLVDFAKQGTTVLTNLDNRPITITKANAAEVASKIDARLQAYEKAMERKGYSKVAGKYQVQIAAENQTYGFNKSPLDIKQQGCLVTLTQGQMTHQGVIVENVLVIEHGVAYPELKLVGEQKGEEIRLTIQSSGFMIERQIPACTLILTKSK